MTRRFALLLAVGFSTLAVSDIGTAEAGRWRFGGGGHVRVHARVPGGVSVTYSRPAWSIRPHYSVGGHIWVGGGYYPRYRYYRPYYYYQPVPSYYGYYYSSSYYPVAPSSAAPGNTVVAATPTRPQLPKFGIGLFAGGVNTEGQEESSDVGVLGRLRLTPGLLIEGEMGKQSYTNDVGRTDRRLGASLVYEIGAYNKLAPYLVAGLGVQQADVDGQYTTTQNFGELGVGLRWALSPQFHLAFDIRTGSRASVSDDRGDAPVVGGTVMRQVTPPAPESDESEEYSRMRLSAMFFF
jgi:hypothetical protein